MEFTEFWTARRFGSVGTSFSTLSNAHWGLLVDCSLSRKGLDLVLAHHSSVVVLNTAGPSLSLFLSRLRVVLHIDREIPYPLPHF